MRTIAETEKTPSEAIPFNAKEVKFGYWESMGEYILDEIEIKPLNEFDKIQQNANKSACRGRINFYPHVFVNSDGAPVPIERFVLPATHSLTLSECINSQYPDAAEFIILIIGFLHGIKLSSEGNGHLFPTPWKEGELVSFTISHSEVSACIEKAFGIWKILRSNEEKANLLYSAIHWFLVSQSYQRLFEKFNWQYTVLDSLYKISCNDKKDASHSKRPEYLSLKYGSPIPESFDNMVYIRSNLIHEAKWLENSIGYQNTKEAYKLTGDMERFNSQIILGILDISCDFRAVEDGSQNYPLGIR